jgi:glycosyltransferase involved in cell wall biosynthesis
MSVRIVILINNPFLTDSRSWKIARSLAGLGAEVTVVARPDDGLREREQRDGFSVVRVAQPRPLGALPAPGLPQASGPTGPTTGKPVLKRVMNAAAETLGRGAQAARYLLLARRWANAIATVVPAADVWQAEGLISLPVALELRRRSGGRVVYDVRDITIDSARMSRLPGAWRGLLARRERGWAQAADATLAANQLYADLLERRYGVRASVVYNGPDGLLEDQGGSVSDQRTAIREQVGIAATTPVVLYLGNVAADRGVEQLCRAMTDVPGAELLIVGPGGAFRDRMVAEAADLPAGKRIHFVPGVAPADIPAWTAVADVAAMPIQPTTLNHRLTTPTRLFDAMGGGVPVVASDLPGMAAIVRETGCGVLCDPSDPADIARALREILGAPPERLAAFRKAGLAAARGPYSWTRQTATIVDVYRSLGVRIPPPEAA